MDENNNHSPNIAQPAAPAEIYYRLGKKTFVLFALKKMRLAAVFFLIAAFLALVSRQSFLTSLPLLGDVQIYVAWSAWVIFIVFCLFFLTALGAAWTIYRNYQFALGNDSFKIKHGVLNKAEFAIPYRQIQNVNIDRGALFQMLGLSRVTILTAGRSDQKLRDDEAEGVLPAIDKELAAWLRDELLKRANIEKVVTT